MFDFVQEKKRFVYIILVLMVLPFAFFGVDSYRHSASVETPATVNGIKISAQEFQNGLRQQQEQLRQRLGANFDPALLEKPEFKHAVLDEMVAQHLLADRAKAVGFIVTDEQIAQYIGNERAFQDNGKFDNKRYATVLANNNLSPLMYEGRVRDELTKQQLNEAYVQNGYVSNTAADKIIRLYEQQRVVSVATVPVQSLAAQVKIEPAAIKKYYDEHQQDFAIPEQAKVEYVKFSADGLMAKTEISTDEVHKFYDEHKADYSQPEQRQASHILIGVAATAPQADQDAAKAKAEKVLAELKQNPAKFADLAKQYSQDPGSAAKGGDLGLFARGMMVKPFDEAAFTLKQGETSGLVKTDFGYHIIKVTAIKASRVLPFDEAREGVQIKLRLQKANEKFAESAEKFTDAVYTQSDSLKPAAEIAGAKIEQSEWLTKGVPSSELWNGKSLQAVFSEDVLKNKHNTAAMEIAPSTLLAARVLEYKPASVKALSDVQAVIQTKLMREQVSAMAAQQGKAALAELQKSGKTTLNWNAAQTVTREQHANLDNEIVRQIFQSNAAQLPQYIGTEMSQGGYTIVRIDAVKDGEKLSEAKQSAFLQQLRQMSGEEIFQAYLADAKSHASIKLNLPATAQIKPE